VDVTILRLLDGTKAYLHAVIDNYSRKILAWTVAGHLDPMNTCQVLREAARGRAASAATSVYMDAGVENINGKVDEFVGRGPLERVLAQIDVSFSNSMIEAWWRSLKHQWLYLNHLDSLATVRKLVAFYVEQHNAVMPHSAFKGQTPDEMYFGGGDLVPDELAARRREALRRRLERNREVACAACPRTRDDEAA
jgi:putative transposase